MKFIITVEGDTEREVLPEFVKRWLKPRLTYDIGIKAINFRGVGDYLKEFGKKSRLWLGEKDVIAVIGLVDLYGLPMDFPRRLDKEEKIEFARKKLTNQVDKKLRHRFRQHFAVFETEAWLLSDPTLFQPQFELPSHITNNPENVNFDKLHRNISTSFIEN
jgi:hypothetical protein